MHCQRISWTIATKKWIKAKRGSRSIYSRVSRLVNISSGKPFSWRLSLRTCDSVIISVKMRDLLTKERRSWNMSRITGKDTLPEMRVRSLLHRMGYRFRVHRRDLPGNPDIVFVSRRIVVFVHGCFWHRHRRCKNCTTPTNRREFWLKKLEGNASRDKRNRRRLQIKDCPLWVAHATA